MIDSRPLAVPDNYEPTDSRALDMPHVVAQWVQNIGGGIGAGMALAAALWLLGADLAAAWRWPVGIAAIVAGASTMVRAYLDEYRSERRWNKREREHRAEMEILTELCDRLEAERDKARTDMQQARSETGDLRNQLYEARAQQQMERREANPKSRGPMTLWSADDKRDGVALMRRWYEMQAWPGEDAMGWSRKRQEAARQLLQDAEIAPKKIYAALTPPEDLMWADARLDAYFAKIASRDASTT